MGIEQSAILQHSTSVACREASEVSEAVALLPRMKVIHTFP